MSQENNRLYDLCIIGAGFSGLVLAITVARAGLLVCLVEQNKMVGRRILSTGNGRCNFSNAAMGKEFYYSNSNLDFINDDHLELVAFLNEIGVIEKSLDGYFYPITNQAKTVREALELELKHLDVDVYLDTTVRDISKNDYFKIKAVDNSFYSKNVVIATGGMAAPTLGTSKLGYKTAAKFGIKVTDIAPALVGLKSDDISLKTIAGVRAQGCVKYKDYTCVGEIQFNKDGISGYPVMCISRFIGLDELKGQIHDLYIDFLPYFSEHDVSDEINRRFNRNKKLTVAESLLGLCHESAISLALQNARIYEDSLVCKLDNEDISSIIYSFKNISFSIIGTKGFNSAQVTAGGISLDDLSQFYEASSTKGLYFIGEVLDVDGICGGYNLQWAFDSAIKAANHLIEVHNDSN